ncbi:FAD-binding oxidoreductase [Lachancea thermotolerans CBS 6340]|uniref:D-lactate dehydrogenase (cytochrome) n=1 Tax=Lachancea thermotolerans (strain ATCC 56472 / CBS 6340 / NRRL Y-8284) TaxID=559295 RepID=C5DLY6_LACTC|nr:KLTH0G04532p [Lachancea thermotolerans CBS 6340]CAR24797.1 KLTH0G04532p [Lachancea thermotolerans CBS 6340]
MFSRCRFVIKGGSRFSTKTSLTNASRSGIRLFSTSPISGPKFLGSAIGFALLSFGLGLAVSSLVIPKQDAQVQTFPLASTTPLEQLDSPRYGSEEDLEKCVDEIRRVVGDELVKNTPVEIDYHTDNGFNPSKPLPHQKPRYIVYPLSTEDVSKIMKIVNQYNIPVVPYSGGTSLEGHTYSTRPGIVLNTSKMNKILQVNVDDLDAVLQAGVGWQDLNEYLSKHEGMDNLMLGCDCGPGAHVCGMISTNASGIGATRYGSMASNVVSIKAVLADGTVIKTKLRPRKSSAGYNLTGLLVGSEGTLAIVTEVVVKLQVKPGYETVAVVQFPDVNDCTKSMASFFKKGIPLNAVELLDADMMRCVNYSDLVSKKFENLPTLFIKIGGLNKVIVDEYVKEVSAISKSNNCNTFEFARTAEEAEELFFARKNALYIMLDYGFNEISPDAKMWITDCAVPLSRLASTLEQLNDMMKEYPLHHMVLGHGDANLHYDIFYTPDQLEMCKEAVDRMAKLTIENEGTCSGEHGIGSGKRALLELELGKDTISMMRKLKLALDPKRLLNPDKVFKIDPLDASTE